MNKKLFLTTFLAILAAAVVIIAGLGAWERVAAWKRAYYALNAQHAAIADSTSRMARYSSNTSLASISSTISMMSEAREEMHKLYPKYVTLLENKPFGLPLTKDEHDDLVWCRKQVVADRTLPK